MSQKILIILFFTECKKLMEASILFRLSIGSQKQHSIFLWRHSSFCNVAVRYQMLYCPLNHLFNCYCQLKTCWSDIYISIDMCETHDESSHAPKKDTSFFLQNALIWAFILLNYVFDVLFVLKKCFSAGSMPRHRLVYLLFEICAPLSVSAGILQNVLIWASI